MNWWWNKISVDNWIKTKSTSNSHFLIIGLVSFMVRSASGSYRSWKCSLAFAIYGFVNLTMRLLAIVDFYIPSLGMLDVLRHLQADRIPFTNPKYYKEFDYNLRYICVRFAFHLVSGFSEGVTKPTWWTKSVPPTVCWDGVLRGHFLRIKMQHWNKCLSSFL